MLKMQTKCSLFKPDCFFFVLVTQYVEFFVDSSLIFEYCRCTVRIFPQIKELCFVTCIMCCFFVNVYYLPQFVCLSKVFFENIDQLSCLCLQKLYMTVGLSGVKQNTFFTCCVCLLVCISLCKVSCTVFLDYFTLAQRTSFCVACCCRLMLQCLLILQCSKNDYVNNSAVCNRFFITYVALLILNKV